MIKYSFHYMSVGRCAAGLIAQIEIDGCVPADKIFLTSMNYQTGHLTHLIWTLDCAIWGSF